MSQISKVHRIKARLNIFQVIKPILIFIEFDRKHNQAKTMIENTLSKLYFKLSDLILFKTDQNVLK